ncbi:MAG TPA: rhamnulokinase family protein [Clostridia bacterium]|nr:rhamnulokinase family protein [Clostridia bacterium]
MLKLLAFDYGASSGRGILGRYDGNVLKLDEVHRFSNDPVMMCGSFYWDILRLYHEMKQGMLKCLKSGDGDFAGIGIDAWGVDFGLLDAGGQLLGIPFHYRDSRNDGMIEEACRIIPKREIYRETGIQFLKFNTLYQLLSMKLNNSPVLEKAETLLFIPDLLNYFLTGVKASEYTIASTSQMYDPVKGDWARGLLSRLGIPDRILTGIIGTGSVVGNLTKHVSEELNLKPVPVIAVAEHDTGSAVVAVPAANSRYAYISSGTWSLLGAELPGPVINKDTYRLNYTNEGGIYNTTRLLKNIMGLWIYQECMRTWEAAGETLSHRELALQASKAKAFTMFIDPDDDMFYSPGNMPERVREYCRKTGQKLPESKGEIVRCIMESLALKYRMTLEGLESVVGYEIPVIHVVGGGTKNTMLNQFTASAAGRPVITGPAEATAVGNLTAQLLALGEVSGLSEARELIRRSFPTEEYLPSERDGWEDAHGRFSKLLSRDY